ncbi:MAG: UvrD-helicase domain-containing protein [Clostridia bacterium]|nr:UvrD-helicase domain-containing protein [Clostridia bacterium]
MRWTPGQQSAIDARNDSVLVSAAAGSGKTAVLVERVLSLLREGGEIDRMLIVTFTRAAAGEMRERIGRRLEEEGAFDAHLRRQAMRIGRAAISTLHVFCLRLLRQHFEAAGIDPMSRVAEEDRLNALRAKARDTVLEEAYADPTEEERALFSQFEDGQIVDMMERLYQFLMAQEDPWGWADGHAGANAAGADAWMPLLEELCRSRLEGAAELLPDMRAALERPGGPERYAPTFREDAALTEALIKAAEGGALTGGKTAFARLSTKKAPPEEDPGAAEAYKELREEWKERVREARELLPEDPDRAEREIAHTLPALRGLCALTKKTAEAYDRLKQAKNYLDYNDLEHLALKALRDEKVRRAVAGQFDALFIDEYQDISGIQEAVLRALHETGRNMAFMVGDVKQSIYRFRLADPTLFLRKYQAYSLEEDAPERKILLQQNFRSDENILLAVNQVFSHAMREKETEIAYDEQAMLRPGGGQPFGAPVEIHLITGEDGEEGGEISRGYRYEAAFAAKRIRELMRFFSVRDGEGSRPLRFRDIAILTRNASGRAPFIARMLQSEGIPVYSDADAQFYDLPEVKDLMYLLQVIDNPLQDIPLLSALRCPCFAFTEEELARIRLVDRAPGQAFYDAFLSVMEKEGSVAEKARRAWAQLDEWRFLARNLPVDELVWRVLEESGLYMIAGAREDGEQRQANLRLLAERAQGESAREGLNAFLRQTGRLRAGDDGKSAKTLGENEDVVRILTLHKSKGLEFPVVFLMETARAFRKGDPGPLRLHAGHGMALQYVDGENRVTRTTCAFRALGEWIRREAVAEEARLLYVGMTRAREKLILLGSPRKLEDAARKWARPASAYAAGAASCMLDWVMTALGGLREGEFTGENGSAWQMCVHPAEELNDTLPRAAAALPEASGPAEERTARRLSRDLPPQPVLKTSVTAIAKQTKEEGDDWESPGDKRRTMEENRSVPVFMEDEDLSAARRGTVTHRVLGLTDYALARRGEYGAALDALEKKGLLTGAERRAIREDWLRGFFSSPLGRRALAADEVHREWAFNLRPDPGADTLVQGVIDLCFLEDGAWVLVDYKTDRADGEELLRRYTEQLRWYARALERITGRPVREALIFSLRSGKAYAVPPAEEK